VLVQRGYADGRVTLRAVCAAAPAGGWAPGIEEIVLGRATQLARQALPGAASRFSASEAVSVGTRFELRFEATLGPEGGILSARGRHWLGFAGEPREGLLCTVACTEPAPGTACEPLLASAAPSGTWLDPPPPNLAARALLLAATSPWEAALALAVASLAAAAVILARRPRPRA
jgi:hypothetical protein